MTLHNTNLAELYCTMCPHMLGSWLGLVGRSPYTCGIWHAKVLFKNWTKFDADEIFRSIILIKILQCPRTRHTHSSVPAVIGRMLPVDDGVGCVPAWRQAISLEKDLVEVGK